jgi:hypothetical protein
LVLPNGFFQFFRVLFGCILGFFRRFFGVIDQYFMSVQAFRLVYSAFFQAFDAFQDFINSPRNVTEAYGGRYYQYSQKKRWGSLIQPPRPVQNVSG